MKNERLIVRRSDLGKIRNCLKDVLDRYGGPSARYMRFFEEELASARILEDDRVPGDVVTLESTIRFWDVQSKISLTGRLMLPHQIDRRAQGLSVLSPYGMALFGNRTGDDIRWGPPPERIALKIGAVVR